MCCMLLQVCCRCAACCCRCVCVCIHTYIHVEISPCCCRCVCVCVCVYVDDVCMYACLYAHKYINTHKLTHILMYTHTHRCYSCHCTASCFSRARLGHRHKHPQASHTYSCIRIHTGAIAASAPLLAFHGLASEIDPSKYWSIVTRDYSPSAGCDSECSGLMRVMHVCMYVSMCACICIYVCVCSCVCVYIYIYVYVYVYIYIYV
jgi:hypothetical protein